MHKYKNLIEVYPRIGLAGGQAARSRDQDTPIPPYAFRFRARFSTVSSAVFTSAYSSGFTLPESFSLSSVKSSSFSAFSSAVFFAAGQLTGTYAAGTPAAGAPAARSLAPLLDLDHSRLGNRARG